ncbi:MAG TPA: amidase family protein [Thermoanaerobaculia bacterium]|nr:amidase family protein [Thermoanaerobaculia bacterium]
MSDPALLSAATQARLIQSRELSPTELLHAALARIERLGPRINAVVTLSETAEDEARALEEALERNEDVGPLAGLLLGVKDVTPVRGLRITYGSPLFADDVPENVATVDALVVERARRAGAVILGKTNTPEFATGGNTFNEVFGRTRNPWNPELSAGGSTGGGAAGLATGMISLAEGTDLGGSLRIPASFCGVVGLRPSPGLVPTWPSAFLWDTLQVTGFMGRAAEDVGLALDATAGASRRVPICQPTANRSFASAARLETGGGDLRRLRLAYCPDLAGIGIDPAVETTCRAAAFELRQAGAAVDEVELDLSFGWRAFLDLRGLWMVVQQHERLGLRERFGPNLKGNVEAGLRVSTEELGAAEHARARVREAVLGLLERYDLLLTPSMAVSPFPVTESHPATVGGREMKTYVDWIAPTFILSLTALPVGSVPCGLDPAGMPAGLQVVGPPFGEEAVLAFAARLQEARPIGPAPLATIGR